MLREVEQRNRNSQEVPPDAFVDLIGMPESDRATRSRTWSPHKRNLRACVLGYEDLKTTTISYRGRCRFWQQLVGKADLKGEHRRESYGIEAMHWQEKRHR